jgi:AcrR family transcriptional regulator
MIDLLDEPKPTQLGRQSSLFSPAKMKIIAAAEKVLGEQSFTTAPLYKIAEASGQSNKSAVQYHFGDRDGLIDAIFAARRELIAARRAHLFDLADRLGRQNDLGSLLQCIYLPQAEQVDDTGRHSYIRFVLQYFVRPEANPAVDSRSSPSGSWGPSSRD